MDAPVWRGAGTFEFLRLSTNSGFAAANNLAVNMLDDCECVALVNPDAFLASDWLEKMLTAASDSPHAASFACLLLQADAPRLQDGAGDVYHCSGLAWRAGHGQPAESAPRAACEVFSPCAAAALYRRQVLIDVNGFDEQFFCYMEDVDLGFRMRLLGWSCMYVPEAKALHVGSASTGGQHSSFAVYHGHRNLVWCYVKNMPSSLFWCCLPLHLMLNLAAIALFTWRGKSKEILRAKRDALKGMPEVWRKRRLIQSRRRVSVAVVWRAIRFAEFGKFLTTRSFA